MTEPRILGQERVPEHLMNEERRAWAKSLGLAQAITAAPVPDSQTVPATPVLAVAMETKLSPLALVGVTVTGRDWIICQLPGGTIRETSADESLAWERARLLSTEEAGQFAVFQPRGIVRPVTQVTTELL